MNIKNKLLRDRFVQKIIPLFGRDLAPKKWVFIVGCYNSGTTLLTSILGQHSDISILPFEGTNLTDRLPRPEQFGWNRMWCRCLERMDPVSTSDGEKIAKRIRSQWAFSYKDRPVLLEKSPANTARMPFLNRHFEPSYFIYIIRNGYAVAEGLRRRSRPERFGQKKFGAKYPIKLCAEQWAVTDRVMERDKAALEHLLPVRYEDLVEKPENTLKTITDFIGISQIGKNVIAGVWNVHGRISSIKNMNGASIDRLNEKDFSTIEAVAGDVLCKYDYARFVEFDKQFSRQKA